MNEFDWLSVGMKPNGKMLLRVAILRLVAKALNVQFKIGGQPYGADYRRAINRRHEASENVTCSSAASAA